MVKKKGGVVALKVRGRSARGEAGMSGLSCEKFGVLQFYGERMRRGGKKKQVARKKPPKTNNRGQRRKMKGVGKQIRNWIYKGWG